MTGKAYRENRKETYKTNLLFALYMIICRTKEIHFYVLIFKRKFTILSQRKTSSQEIF